MKKKVVINVNPAEKFKDHWNIKDSKLYLMPIVITLVFAAVVFWFAIPAVSLKSVGFWIYILNLICIYTLVKIIYCSAKQYEYQLKVPVLTGTVIFCVMLGLMFADSRIFHAKKYSEILKVSDDTIEIIPSVSGSSSIALMDTASAERLGDRRIGSLSEVVSQFNVGSYMQINYQETPVKVAPLRYDGFFKWMSNQENGIPGYVIVNPVNMSADYKSLNNGMFYVPSAYFTKDLARHVRFNYPFDMIENLHFEIDEEGNPWYVGSVIDHTIGLFGGKTVTGAVVINPLTGETAKYSISEVPAWVDVVFDGDLICEKYNDYAQLKHGFLNSLFAQTDCRQVTTIKKEDEDGDTEIYPDYGYIAKDNDIWIYTGVTSVNGDSSNLGFILANERTAETRYIPCAGADEFSGMKSAEGEVQEKGYTASFPSLINVDNTPTYIMVLKDNNNLVKMYAAVNVEQYNIVSTAVTQKECIEKYKMLLTGDISSNSEDVQIVDPNTFTAKTITIAKIRTIDQNGNTYIYIVDENQNIYSAKYADVLGMLLVEEGDTITILTDGSSFLLPQE